MPKVKYAGVPVNDLIVPALSIGQAEEFNALVVALAPLEGEKRPGYTKRLLPLVAAAVRRNYPEMTDEQLADTLDFGSFNRAVEAALGIAEQDKTRGE